MTTRRERDNLALHRTITLPRFARRVVAAERHNVGQLGAVTMDASNRERKKLWKAKQRSAARAAFPLADELMESLFQAVGASVAEHGCDHTRRFTDQWLLGHPESRDRVLAWLEENGGFCDCEVDANPADHWERNRR